MTFESSPSIQTTQILPQALDLLQVQAQTTAGVGTNQSLKLCCFKLINRQHFLMKDRYIRLTNPPHP